MAKFWDRFRNFCSKFDNFCHLGLKVTYMPTFLENGATYELYTWKESWNHLEISFEPKKVWFVPEKFIKRWFYQFLTQKLGGLNIFVEEFLKISNNESKIWLHWDMLKSSTHKLINNWKQFSLPKKKCQRIYSGGG